MTFLAYIDVRPFLFMGGLSLFTGLCLLVCGFVKADFNKWKVALFSALIFTALFALFLTGVGPFVDQKQTREYWMTWEIKPVPSNAMKESEVALSFVDFPGHSIVEYSDELATHLRQRGERKVKVIFEVTSDYGKVRGFHGTEIAGLRDWKSEWGYSGASGSPKASPWD
jgi:hypothetical protein